LTCQELTDFLDAWVHDELPSAQRTEFERHVKDCPGCVSYTKAYRRTVELGRRAFECPDDRIPEKVPEELVRSVLAARKASAK
jgi:anti-sigma factor RsiW